MRMGYTRRQTILRVCAERPAASGRSAGMIVTCGRRGARTGRRKAPRPADPPHLIVNPLVHIRFGKRAKQEAGRRKVFREAIRAQAAQRSMGGLNWRTTMRSQKAIEFETQPQGTLTTPNHTSVDGVLALSSVSLTGAGIEKNESLPSLFLSPDASRAKGQW